MTTELYIISGFLGAGKTTLIQKLLKEGFQNEKVILIENDFGEISVDAALLKSSSIEVKEINSGCICCSLSGDFIKALREVLDRFQPDKIIIEPSGVGKLSDIVKCCSDSRIQALAKVKLKVTIADVKRCRMYLENFGEFFEDQIENADVILLSRTENNPDRVDSALSLLRGLNTHASIITKPWNEIDLSALLLQNRRHNTREAFTGRETRGEQKQYDIHPLDTQETHKNHEHEGNCCHEHGDHGHHHAEEVFDTVTIRTRQIFGAEDLKARVSAMEQSTKGTILRAKGIVRGTNGYLSLQYLPGDIQISSCTAMGDLLCIIGRNLNRRELCTLFDGE